MSDRGTTRRELLTRAARAVGITAAVGTTWAYVIAEQGHASPFALRPPGALPEPDFLATCIRCGQCVGACPYDTLHLARVGDPVPLGTPHFVPREVPCRMCEDIPCVAACPTGALSADLTDIRAADMGLAVIVDQENCLSYRGLRCEICYRDCPAQGRAISVKHLPRGTSKHARFIPVVHSEACTGCGVCERSCPLSDAAIKVLPRALAKGRLGAHYGFSEDAKPALTQEFEPADAAAPSAPQAVPGLDYLNRGEW